MLLLQYKRAKVKSTYGIIHAFARALPRSATERAVLLNNPTHCARVRATCL